MGSVKLMDSIKKRRTFAIISHPDAGKTTLTEKFLLYGGAVRLAGTVKSRKSKQYAISDWMELEKQRGISITSSVLQFEYRGKKINILDTPGHQDFSEDTYRTLIAADSAVMVIDSAKGIEAQTKKLFQVCRDRGIPIFTFVNKLDRHGKEPLELLDEIEKILGINAYPMNWPIGMGSEFTGIYDRVNSEIELYSGKGHGQTIIPTRSGDITDPGLAEAISPPLYKKLKEDIELLDMAGYRFDIDLIAKGKLTPVYFGSALTNFGLGYFLDSFVELAPTPGDIKTSAGIIKPDLEEFSGFVFKIQANMNPAHRDRIAFVRICTGFFRRGMVVKHVPTGKIVRLSQSKQFMAQDCSIVDEAYPGDIIGLFDSGLFRIGDTLTEVSNFTFEDIPRFQPEFFARVRLRDAMKRKQFIKGIEELTEEGAVQRFRDPDAGVEAPILGAVGVLQFDVIKYRLIHEYGVDIELENLPFTIARWVAGEEVVPRDLSSSENMVVVDDNDYYVVLFRNEWSLNWEINKKKHIQFLEQPHLKGAKHAFKRTSGL
ncbi:MAG: peptide chain release factor 3 [Peptococcaceae bacterium BICA1-7]|nr:MAG: peptide chain release factor 3 [Peptococcaceae bacterium BICA1-7]HBV97815.1 peptide chain release factor 3 [Desulfotomaculum sp.]